jgi:beta-lactam-binding protein with PASTA domain
MNYKTAEIKLRDANLNIRILANRHDLQLAPGIVVAQTPQGGERVDCATVIGVTLSSEGPGRNSLASLIYRRLTSGWFSLLWIAIKGDGDV